MELKNKIVSIREENKLTQEEFAEMLFVSRQSVSNWENGKCYPDLETILLISDKFKVSLDVLLKEDKDMVKNIDKAIQKGKHRWCFFCSAMVLSCVLFWYTYKSMLVYRGRYYNVPYLNECVNNSNAISVELDKSSANANFENLNFYLPSEFDYEETEGDTLNRVYLKNGARALWITTANDDDWKIDNKALEMDNFLKTNEYDFLKTSEFNTPEKVFNYYIKHQYEEPSIFWSRKHLSKYHFVHEYIEGLVSSVSCELYLIDSVDWFGTMYVRGDFYVAELQHAGKYYYVRFNKQFYQVDDVKIALTRIYFD